MSRRITDASRILVTPSTNTNVWSWFFWVKLDDAFTSQKILCRTGGVDPIAFGTVPTSWYMQVNWGPFSYAADTDIRNNQWVPVLLTSDGSQQTMDIADLPRVTKTQSCAFTLDGGLRHNDSNFASIGKNFAESAVWNAVLSRAEYDAMTDTGSGNAPNPSITRPGNLVTYLSMNSANLQSESGLEALTWVDEGGAHDAAHPPVTQLAAGSMVFNDPSPLAYRVGTQFTNYDTAAWFAGYTGTLTVTFDELPSGITATGNLLNGTLDTSVPLNTVATGVDSDWPGSPVNGIVEWDITGYTITFGGDTRIEDDANDRVTTDNLVVSLLEGSFTDDLTAVTPIHLGPYSISNGELTLFLPDAEYPEKQYQILLEDTDETNTPLGVYDRTSI